MTNHQEIQCPHCGRVTTRGFTVCQGCSAEIVYGSTHEESLWYLGLGGFAGGLLVAGFEKVTRIHVPMPWYLGFIISGAVILGGFLIARASGKVTFIRQYRHK